MTFRNTVLFAVAAIAATALAKDAIPTDTAAIAALLNDPAGKSSLDIALSSAVAALSGALDTIPGIVDKSDDGEEHPSTSEHSGAASIKPVAAMAAVAGLTVCAALF
ncbi:hypothetical protein H4R19_004468 [Coemansia spiralis]|nr:hypothetical protein H4R19_004468 [Coemansia spiralis]